MSRIIVSSFGREGEKGFKYTEIQEDIIDEDNLFGDIVDHWTRRYDWDNERDEVYPDENALFEGRRSEREIRMRKVDDEIIVEYGIPTNYDHSQGYVDSVWEDQMLTILERNSDFELEDHHVIKRTLNNISGLGKKKV